MCSNCEANTCSGVVWPGAGPQLKLVVHYSAIIKSIVGTKTKAAAL